MEAGEAHPARLGGRHFEAELLQPLGQHPKEPLRLRLVSECADKIIRIPNPQRIPITAGLHDPLEPEVERVVQVDVRQDWRDDAPLRGPGVGVNDLAVRVQDAGFEPFSNQVEEGAVVNPLPEHVQQPVVVHVVEEAFDVGLDDVVTVQTPPRILSPSDEQSTTYEESGAKMGGGSERLHDVPELAELEVEGQLGNRCLRAPVRPVAVAVLDEVLFVDGSQQLGTGQLNQFVFQRRDAQRPFLPVFLGYVATPHQPGAVRLGLQSLRQVLKVGFQVFLVDRRGDSVDATGRFLVQVAPAMPQKVRVQFPVEVLEPVVFASFRSVGYSPQ